MGPPLKAAENHGVARAAEGARRGPSMGPPLKAAENALWRRSVAIEYDLQWGRR